MLLLERHGKTLLREHGVNAPEGFAVSTPQDLDAALLQLQYPVALKAQVPAGARGKNGGIVFANDRDQAHAMLEGLLGKSVSGHVVGEVLVEPRVAIKAERYLAALIHEDEIHIMACPQGGVDIEVTAIEHPEQIFLLSTRAGIVDRVRLASELRNVGFPAGLIDKYSDVCQRLCQLMKNSDATLAEINPLVETSNDDLIALDARIDIDDAALSRQTALAQFIDEPVPKRGSKLPSVKAVATGGPVGLIGLGGGLNLSIIDWLSKAGRPVAAVADIDDAIAQNRIAEFIRQCVTSMREQHGISILLINAISCGYVLDEVAEELLDALATLPGAAQLPVVFNFHGRGSVGASDILARRGQLNSLNLEAAINRVQKILEQG
ncbi:MULTISPECIES: ATP-grasp domain-containing protein [unclassified Rhizobium]|uniref:ATP-grasp domain-containing protein n=1 Tax=unclassified Rhizobium TaxID=2613769 RepID=UPI0006FE6680|nr:MULTISPECIES: ATP-grasp domain-containing protein [unclassified Rhizobium]KQV39377.1 hypothetical protein ASC86_22850 [Rhizobium sp. Root1212]KRD35382.1 hypothetical protein ASE37_21420 [Rhizobium sp. Root268]